MQQMIFANIQQHLRFISSSIAICRFWRMFLNIFGVAVAYDRKITRSILQQAETEYLPHQSARKQTKT